MKELKKIMKIRDYNERSTALLRLAQKLGVSTTRSVNASTGRTEENIIIERIQQAYIVKQACKTWLIAVTASIASVLSAIAAWVAIFVGK